MAMVMMPAPPDRTGQVWAKAKTKAMDKTGRPACYKKE